MLINLSNHPTSKWSEKQFHEAQRLFGECIDIPFPNVSPLLDITKVEGMALNTLDDIVVKHGSKDVVIHVMGETTFVFCFVSEALRLGIRCVASTTERVVIDNPDGTKTSIFQFVKFRTYGN